MLLLREPVGEAIYDEENLGLYAQTEAPTLTLSEINASVN
jgi:hypothetical protein